MDKSELISIQGESRNWASTTEPEASVILPTFERPDDLMRVLSSFEKQESTPNLFEIIVTDDGSRDHTSSLLSNFAAETSLPFKFVSLKENRGPAAARNMALRHIRGNLVIIIGDDIEPNPRFIAQHINWHRQNPEESAAVLGFVTWPEQIKKNGFMKWMETGGHAFFFDYISLQDGVEADPAVNFYTCNVSLKSSMLFKTSLFDESFPYASHEDNELGYRLKKLGMKLYFARSVKAYHWHRLTLITTAKRIYIMGYTASLYWQKVGDYTSLLRRGSRIFLTHLFRLPQVDRVYVFLLQKARRKAGAHPVLWRIILYLSYWLGMADAKAGRPLYRKLG